MTLRNRLQPPPRVAKQTTYTPKPQPVARGSGLLAAALAHNPPDHTQRAIATLMKTPERKSQKIRDSANGEECAVRIPGVCNHDPATTVWSHAPLSDAGRSMGLKAVDILGCYSCAACHDVVDGRAPRPEGMPREQVLLDWFYGHLRSLVKLKQKGLA